MGNLSLEAFSTEFATLTMAHGRGDIQYKPGKSFHSYRNEGKELLAAFNRDLPQEDCNILAVEQAFTCQLENLPVPLVGIWNLVLEDAAVIITIVDHKSTSKAHSLADVNQHLQMTVYHLAALANGCAKRDILLRVDCLIKTKTPKFEQYYTTRGQWEEQRAVRTIHAVWDGSTGRFHPQ